MIKNPNLAVFLDIFVETTSICNNILKTINLFSIQNDNLIKDRKVCNKRDLILNLCKQMYSNSIPVGPDPQYC